MESKLDKALETAEDIRDGITEILEIGKTRRKERLLSDWEIILNEGEFFIEKKATLSVCSALKYIFERFGHKAFVFRKRFGGCEYYDFVNYAQRGGERLNRKEMIDVIEALGYKFIFAGIKNDSGFPLFWVSKGKKSFTPLRQGISFQEAAEVARNKALEVHWRIYLWVMPKGKDNLNLVCAFRGTGKKINSPNLK